MERRPVPASLCAICDGIVSRVKQPDSPYRSGFIAQFHDITDWVESARMCHLCALLLNSSPLMMERFDIEKMLLDRSESHLKHDAVGHASESTGSKQTKDLEAHVTYFRDVGFSILLKSNLATQKTRLTNIDFTFGGPPVTMAYPKSDSTRSLESWACINQWITSCTEMHPHCRSNTQSFSLKSPTRLLHVGTSANPELRVCETAKFKERCSYMTLSHCWGDEVPLRLLKANYTEFMWSIPHEMLPKTFQDAIEVTRNLEIAYLWIDSLCIIQDSVSDWEMEANRMHFVYSNSWLNIAAAAAPNSNGGLFQPRDPSTFVPCTVNLDLGDNAEKLKTRYHGDHNGSFETWTPHDAGLPLWVFQKRLLAPAEQATTRYQSDERFVKTSPLLDRGWVFQERLLAPRVLSFASNEIFWECESLYASETFPEGIIGEESQEFHRLNEMKKLRRYWRSLDKRTPFELWRLWNRIATEYAPKKTSRATDKLVAISGLASGFQEIWRSKSIQYLAGLCSYRLRQGLLWVAHKDCLRPAIQRAPTWSWASLDGLVNLYSSEDLPEDGFVEILDAYVEPSKNSVFGQSFTGRIRLSGPLKPFKIIRKSNSQRKAEFTIEIDASSTIIGCFTFDEAILQNDFKAGVVFMMPFELEVMKSDRYDGRDDEDSFQLQGLVFTSDNTLPEGHFRRLGHFIVRGKNPSSPSLSSDPDENSAPDGNSNHAPEETAPPWQENTSPGPDSIIPAQGYIEENYLDVDDANKDRQSEHQSSEGSELSSYQSNPSVDLVMSPNFLEFYENRYKYINRLADDDEKSLMGDGDISDENAQADDPFFNGSINRNLSGLLGDESFSAKYPNICALLKAIKDYSDWLRQNSNGQDLFYEENHGGGFYTIQIV